MEVPDSILKSAFKGVVDREVVDRHCLENSLEVSSFWNAMSLEIARRYINREVSFTDADDAVNAIYSRMLDVCEQVPFAEPAYSIFLAFDAGEYDHGDGKDPEVTYTIPELERILREA